MYPTLFRIGTFEVTSFGALLAIAALVAFQIFQRETRRSSLPPSAVDAGLVGIVGGLLGTKLLWAVSSAVTRRCSTSS
jgi:prolipoprotein diacylglyceryltransferase